MNKDVQSCRVMADVKLGRTSTDEQIPVIEDFEHNILSNSDAGTGKTTTAIKKIVVAELSGVVSGKNITAIAFTRTARNVMEQRYKDACLKMHLVPKASFKTLHQVCFGIIKEHHDKLGLPKFDKPESLGYGETVDYILGEASDLGIPVSKKNVGRVKKAVESLNSSLIFDPEHIMSKYDFKECGLSLEDFSKIRGLLYKLNLALGTIQLGDILLYTLQLLLEHPEIAEAEREKRKLVICDEFQDLSLLQLHLLYLISGKLMVIGDISQQIYGFQGACGKIVDRFKEYYPDHREYPLTQSFRCGIEIAEHAKKIVRFNGNAAEAFKGLEGRTGNVSLSGTLDINNICKDLKKDYEDNFNRFERDIMFIYRNNHSAIPVYEALYQNKLPFRSDKYIKATKLPVISDLIDLIELAKDPHDVKKLKILLKILPEFKPYTMPSKCPLGLAMKDSGESVFSINYTFKNDTAGSFLMRGLLNLREKLLANATLGELFNAIYSTYKSLYLKDNEYKLEQEAKYYTDLVQGLTHKTYDDFIFDETEKKKVVDNWNARMSGIRCYTIHGCKGEEADDVYILDASQEVLPNAKQVDKRIKAKCTIDVAELVRNERSLLYVGETRAKHNLYVGYKGLVSAMVSGINEYEIYDRAYITYKQDFDDVDCFKEFIYEDYISK